MENFFTPAVGDLVLIEKPGFSTAQTVRKIDRKSLVCTNGWKFDLVDGEWTSSSRHHAGATIRAA